MSFRQAVIQKINTIIRGGLDQHSYRISHIICANKKINGCSARAKVSLLYKNDKQLEPPGRILFDWPKDPNEEHADAFVPDKGKVLADKMVEEMSSKVKDDPSIPLDIRRMSICSGK